MPPVTTHAARQGRVADNVMTFVRSVTAEITDEMTFVRTVTDAMTFVRR